MDDFEDMDEMDRIEKQCEMYLDEMDRMDRIEMQFEIGVEGMSDYKYLEREKQKGLQLLMSLLLEKHEIRALLLMEGRCKFALWIQIVDLLEVYQREFGDCEDKREIINSLMVERNKLEENSGGGIDLWRKTLQRIEDTKAEFGITEEEFIKEMGWML